LENNFIFLLLFALGVITITKRRLSIVAEYLLLEDFVVSNPSPRTSLELLSAFQRAVLDALWEAGAGTVYDVLERLPAEDRQLPYTSVLSALKQLEKAGWVTHEERAAGKVRQFVFAPTCTRDQAQDSTLGRIVEVIFGGDAYQLAQRLFAHESLSSAELASLQNLLNERRRQAGRRPPDV
jgi:predicted transcriptional regulator